MNRDIHTHLDTALGLAPQAVAEATVTGSEVDLLGYQAAAIRVLLGSITGSAVVTIQERNDTADDWTAVSDDDLQGTNGFTVDTDSNAVQELGYLGNMRYLRVEVAGSTTGGDSTQIAVAVDRAKGHVVEAKE